MVRIAVGRARALRGAIAAAVLCASTRSAASGLQPLFRSRPECPRQYLEAFGADELRFCELSDLERQSYLHGSWVQLPEQCQARTFRQLRSFAYGYDQECENPRYECGPGTSGCEERVLKIAKWAWQPSDCRLRPFDAGRLSRLLAGKKTLFIGDSTMRQFFWALGQLMETAGVVNVNTNRATAFQTVHGSAFAVHGVEFLTGRGRDAEDQTYDSTAGAEWMELVGQADYIIFNTGFHHHRRDMEFEHYQEVVDTVMRAMKETFAGRKLFFLTTVWAHERCGQIAGPLGSYVPHDGVFHWYKPIVNEYRWQEAARANGMDNFLLLNSSMSLLRGDGHVSWKRVVDGSIMEDCLHQCMPGLPDYYNWLVAHALIEDADAHAAGEEQGARASASTSSNGSADQPGGQRGQGQPKLRVRVKGHDRS